MKSRILYEQMLGRATRRADHIGKETFKICDAVGIYDALKDYTQMQPVVANPKTSFTQLAGELKQIESADRAIKQIEQILAKLQRKRRHIDEDREDRFKYHSGKKTRLSVGNDDLSKNAVYKWDDVSFLFYKNDIGSNLIRVFWNDFDSEWNQSNLKTTKKRFEKFYDDK